jgi:copper chaperone
MPVRATRQEEDSARTARARIVVLEAVVDWAMGPDRDQQVLGHSASATPAQQTLPTPYNPTASRQKRKNPMTNSNFTVVGMTCNSCAMTVSEEVTQVPGVQDVAVELSTGRLTVISDSSLDPALIKVAVEEAGYQLASS